MKLPYTAELSNDDGKFYVKGPGNAMEFSYYGGTLCPSSRMNTEKEANLAAKLTNLGYITGYKQAQKDIRNSLGIHNLE